MVFVIFDRVADPVERSVYLVDRYIIDVCTYQGIDYRRCAGIKADDECDDEPYYEYNDQMYKEA